MRCSLKHEEEKKAAVLQSNHQMGPLLRFCSAEALTCVTHSSSVWAIHHERCAWKGSHNDTVMGNRCSWNCGPAKVWLDDRRWVSAQDNWVTCIIPVCPLRSMPALSGKAAKSARTAAACCRAIERTRRVESEAINRWSNDLHEFDRCVSFSMALNMPVIERRDKCHVNKLNHD